jgi:hypothetical protein
MLLLLGSYGGCLAGGGLIRHCWGGCLPRRIPSFYFEVMARQTDDIKFVGTVDDSCFYEMQANTLSAAKALLRAGESGRPQPLPALAGAAVCWAGPPGCTESLRKNKKQRRFPPPYRPGETANHLTTDTAFFLRATPDKGRLRFFPEKED